VERWETALTDPIDPTLMPPTCLFLHESSLTLENTGDMFHDIPPPMLARMREREQIDRFDRTDGTPRLKRLRQIPPEVGKFIAILVADNAINHEATLRPMLDLALQDGRVDALIVPIGHGELVCRKR
jgi:predicted O-methyltransferase YrrM